MLMETGRCDRAGRQAGREQRQSQRETGDRQTDREGQMDMPTARLDGVRWTNREATAR